MSPVSAAPPMGIGVPNVDVDIVPTGSAGHGMSGLWNSDKTTTQTTSGGNKAGNIIGDIADVVGLVAAPFTGGASLAAASAVNALAHAARGGKIPHRANAGPVPKLPTNSSVTIDASGAPQLPTGGYGGLTGGTISTPNFGGMMTATGPQSVQDYLAQQKAGEWTPPPTPAPTPPTPAAPPPDPSIAMALASEQQAADAQAWSGGHNRDGGRTQRRDEGGPIETDDLPESFYDPASSPAPTMGMGSASPQRPAMNSKAGGDPWRALMYTGLGMMGGTSPNALTNIGQGALKGLSLYEQDQSKRANADALAAYRQQQGQVAAQRQGEQVRHNKTDEETAAQRMMNAADEAAARLKIEAGNEGLHAAQIGIEGANSAETRRYHDEELAQGHYTWQPGAGKDDQGNSIEGSWRYSTKGDEPPKFYPGVVQQRTTNADQRQTNFNTTQQATQAWRDTEAALRSRGLDDNTVSNTMNNAARMVAADPSGKLTLPDAVKQLQTQRQTIAPAAPSAAPAPPTVPPAALEYLHQHPELAPQFKQKYGYLPGS